jgi:predicted DNA-binding transcriptional regulator YafY
MVENKSQFARLLFIDRAIRSGMQGSRLANCTTLAAEYEVSSKTILRDIDYLRLHWESPIAYDPQRKGYFYTEESYALPAIHLNEGDLFGLAIAHKGLEQYRNTPIYDKLAALFRKIEQSLPERVSLDAAWLDSRISVLPEQQTTINPAVWAAVAAGLTQSRTLRLAYQKPGAAAPEIRAVDPYHVLRHQGAWYLIGHCHLRRDVRNFALSRISEAVVRSDSFVVPTDFDPAAVVARSFGLGRGTGQYRVRLRFVAAAAPYVLERVWQPEQQLARHRDGSVTLTLTAGDLAAIKRWVLSWGSEVEVLAPKALIGAVQEEIRGMAACYGGPARRGNKYHAGHLIKS